MLTSFVFWGYNARLPGPRVAETRGPRSPFARFEVRAPEHALERRIASRYIDAMGQVSDVIDQTASNDPAIGLRGVASLRVLLETVEELHVRRARAEGWSWQQIAAPLGVSKQAVHQKYGRESRPARRRTRP
jgi:hypothetical protein